VKLPIKIIISIFSARQGLSDLDTLRSTYHISFQIILMDLVWIMVFNATFNNISVIS